MPDVPPPRLPADVTALVGRGTETTEIRRLLAHSRLVTLTGIGGVGKSRLAVHVGRKAERGFADHATLVELAEVADPALVAMTVAQVVGAPVHQSDVVATLVDYLRGREMLMVLDNCEHLLDETAILVRNLLSACPGLRILATSREPLRVTGEHIFKVEPLPVHVSRSGRGSDDVRPEAMRLFEERATAAAPDFRITADNERTVEELCRRLDGLPLAIELAAGRMRALSPRELLVRLDDHHRLLSLGDRSAAPRHQSLWATLDWSYDLCSKHERLLWERMSIFTGSIYLNAAECVCSDDDLPREVVVEHIAALVDKSILVMHNSSDGPTYRMLETVREYGLRKLREDPLDAAVVGRYRAYYQRLAREFDENWFGPGQEEMVERMRREQANLRAVLDSLVSDPEGGRAALGMSSALFWYWLGCGQQREGRHWLDRCLALDDNAGPERAAALWANGYLAIAEGKAVVALDLLRGSQDAARQAGDAIGLAHATHIRGIAEHNLGNPSLGMTLIEEGMAMESENGTSAQQVLAMEHLGWALCHRQEPERALAVLEQGLHLCKELGERWSLSWVLTFTGLAHWMRGDAAAAARALREALAVKRPFHDVLGIAVVVELLSWVACAEGDAVRSARLLGAVRRMWEPLGIYPGGFELRSWSSRTEADVRKVLGEKEFEYQFEEGARMEVDRTIDYALGEESSDEAELSSEDALLALLTPRETQIAQLLAQGLTNKQIAQTLVIALRTVDSHVEHIFTKFGVNSRTQVAVLLATQRR